MNYSCNTVYSPVLPNGAQKYQCICHFKFVKFIYIPSMLPAGCICFIIFLSTVTLSHINPPSTGTVAILGSTVRSMLYVLDTPSNTT